MFRYKKKIHDETETKNSKSPVKLSEQVKSLREAYFGTSQTAR